MAASQRKSSRGISAIAMNQIRAYASITTVALVCSWAGYSYHAMLSAPAPAPPVDTHTFPDMEGLVKDVPPPSRAPWDSRGCQTIAFFHIPKTGGESMNELWKTLGNHEPMPWWRDSYTQTSLRHTGCDLNEQEDLLRSIKPWGHEHPKLRHKVVELHCGDAMSFMQARKVLREMRVEHEANDCGFFAFTVIRSPLEWLLSLYNDICHRRLRGHMDSCPQQDGMSPKDEILKYPHRDGIVSYLTHGWKGWYSPGPVDESVVQDLISSMKTHLDLVAFTNEVPLLRKYLTKRFAAPFSILSREAEAQLHDGAMQNTNHGKKVTSEDFNAEELERLNSTIQLDWKLYEALAANHKPIVLKR